ncbi:putative F-box domain, FBD domain, leucine-rich repeat domain superfamily [Helianthus annuus]|nr:putative F-box domain, FBD domain, leucine-rich repeat domain superfamily [Helianthus annuus]
MDGRKRIPMDDRMSNLPPSIIQKILTLMPMPDAFRTSILSRNWRCHCRNISKLCFDNYQFHPRFALSNKSTFLHDVVYPVLLLHQGPILEFSLRLNGIDSRWEIDQIIVHLSRNYALKEFQLWIWSRDEYKLLPAFFNLQHLTVLKLQNCAFQPPVTFKGFERLVILQFYEVSITAEVFQRFISNCPLLKEFTLIGDERHFLGTWSCNFIELFEHLPLVERLCMSSYPIQCFAKGAIPQKLPNSLVHLKRLDLCGFEFCFGRQVDLLSALLLVTSSPNIETINIEMGHYPTEAVSQTVMNLIDHQDYSYVTLDHLRVIEIYNFTNMKTGMDFVKLILAKSPMLKKVAIHFNEQVVDIHGRVKILEEMIQYARASAKAAIVIINKE